MDTITINDLEVFYHVGVPAVERARPQRLLVTVQMEHDFTEAAAVDDLAKTIDYFAVSRRLLRYGDRRSWKLIEKLASDLAAIVLKEFGPRAVSVEIKKFILTEARFVSVRVRRERPS